MITLPKTIQIFLPDGNARSIRIAEITSRTVQAMQIPRSKLAEAGKREEVKNVGVYFLFGDADEEALERVYIGEAEDCYERLKQHKQYKEFWRTAVVVTSKTMTFTKAHARYLEWYCCKRAQEIGRYAVTNKTNPSKPHIREAEEADILDYYETMRILLATLGYPILEEIEKPQSESELLVCRGKGAVGYGLYTEEEFVVQKDSTATWETTPSAQDWIINTRKQLFEEGVLVPAEEGKTYRFAKDQPFKTPTGGSAVILGRSSNGWTAWKNKAGQTLDELIRQPLNE